MKLYTYDVIYKMSREELQRTVISHQKTIKAQQKDLRYLKTAVKKELRLTHYNLRCFREGIIHVLDDITKNAASMKVNRQLIWAYRMVLDDYDKIFGWFFKKYPVESYEDAA